MSYEDADIVRSCTRKKAYPSVEVARFVVSAILRQAPDAELRPYACTHCGSWHVGAAPQRLPSEEEVESFTSVARSGRETSFVAEDFIKARRRRAAWRRGERGSYRR